MSESLNINENNVIFKWKIPEYEKHTKSKTWYFRAVIVFLILLFFSLYGISFFPLRFYFEPNFLFIIIITLYAIITILNDSQNPKMIDFIILENGLQVGRKFYDFDEMLHFSILYKPQNEVKNLYFEFKNKIRPRLSIPLLNNNPLPIRDFLKNFVEEDLERTGQPISEGIAKLLKM